MKRWIKCRNKPVQVEAWPCGVKGLFINKDSNPEAAGYAITHRASGLRLGDWHFKRRSDAVLVAQELTRAKGVDWTIADPWDLVTAHPGLKEAMRNIIEYGSIDIVDIKEKTSEWADPNQKRKTPARSGGKKRKSGRRSRST